MEAIKLKSYLKIAAECLHGQREVKLYLTK